MRRLRAILATVVLLAVTAGCANIPEQSNPQVAGPADTSEPESTVAPVPHDADPLTIVREFVAHATNPDIAKQYLTEDAARTWEPDPHPTIMERTFGTFPPSVQEPNTDGTTQTVLIHGTKVGRLGVDNSFYPAGGSYDDRAQLRRQADGQWRISKPPATTAITIDAFMSAYRLVRMYYFDQELSVPVPDLRYVVQQPSEGLPSRVMQVLASGPSDMLDGPLRSLLGEAAGTTTNAVVGPDGDLDVTVTDLGDASLDTRKKIAAQIVMSLQGIATGDIRLTADGAPLVPGHDRWRLSDVPFYSALTTPSPDSAGMFVSGGRLRSLKDGTPVPGPAGSGAYQVQSAAQSIDGTQLAVVEKHGKGVRLRLGKLGGPLAAMGLTANTMTRPSWQPSGNEVWTVVNGTTVVRFLRTKDGTWAPATVNSAALAPFGAITVLRLSRDGTRLAMIADQRVVVAGVDRRADTASVKLPRTLMQDELGEATGVDWMEADKLVVATQELRDSVVSVPFDGLQETPYDISNLTVPVNAIAAATNSPVIVTDHASRMWTSAEPGEAWRAQGVSGFDQPVPFYPG